MADLRTRRQALKILTQGDSGGAYISVLLSRSARNEGINFKLLQRLVKGTVEWRARIDTKLNEITKNRFGDFSSELQNILRLAAYQFIFLKEVPEKLVVIESLQLIKEVGGSRHVKSLRHILEILKEEGPRASSGAEEDQSKITLNTPQQIADYYSHPKWVIERWIQELGVGETRFLCATNNQPWLLSIRTNTLKISTHQLRKKLAQEGVKFSESRYLPESTVITRLPRSIKLHELESFKRGLFQVQDESAALIGHLVAPRSGEFVVDLCAAPGGKTTHLATLMRNRGEILACDLNPKRLEIVRLNCKRLGLSIARTRVADASLLRLPKLADKVLLDAPCSGFGTLGRKGDIRWAKDEATIAELSALQKKMLRHAASLVRPGGKLIYSTCTLLREENEEIIEEFLRLHAQFKISALQDFPAKNLLTKEGYFKSWPHRHGIGGAFGVVLERVT